MLFNSLGFLLVFLPITVLGFMLIGRKGGIGPVAWLSAASLVFYGYWDWRFLGLLIGSTIFNFACALYLARSRSKPLMVAGITVNLGLLAWFKYGGFLAHNLSDLFGLHIGIPSIILPLAISFFTFHQIAYLVDVWRGDEPEHSLLHYSLFIFFFPHLIAGPVLRHWELLPQFRRPDFRCSVENFSVGMAFLAMGLVKKLVLASALQAYSDRVFRVASFGDTVTLIPAWMATLCFAMQIYFDFSGYSDMAIGLARLFGVRLPVNFNSPYKATSIIDFWRRWHITLSRFLRDYLYIPLGGSRHGGARRQFNLMIVMLLGGLWHGSAWTFVGWGGIHGAALVVNHLWRTVRGDAKAGPWETWLGWTLTMAVVAAAWVAFRAPNWLATQTMWSGMASLNGIFLPESYGQRLGPLSAMLAHLGVHFQAPPDTLIYPNRMELALLFGLGLWTVALPNSQELMAHFNPVFERVVVTSSLTRFLAWRPGILSGMGLGLVVAGSLLLILQKPDNAFIYFQF